MHMIFDGFGTGGSNFTALAAYFTALGEEAASAANFRTAGEAASRCFTHVGWPGSVAWRSTYPSAETATTRAPDGVRIEARRMKRSGSVGKHGVLNESVGRTASQFMA